jgi:acyl carrier protein
MDIENKVKAIVAEHLHKDEDKITTDSRFIDDLGADSLDLVELVMAFEENFNCEIPDEAAEKIVKISDAVKYITEHNAKDA